ncbi:MAG TPA: YfhO family protein [Thermoanaerobaculia bacterium]
MSLNPTWIYAGLVYAVAVWLLRRGGVRELRPHVAAFFYLLVLLFLWRPMTGDYVNLPVDFVQTLPPWAYLARHPHAYNSQLNDLTLQLVPWAHQVRESWLSFTAPLWNSASGSGYPLLAGGQSSALSPLRILALPLPLGFAMTAEAAWKLLIGMTLTFLFCRRRGYSEVASVIGGVCYGFCTFLVVWLHFPLATVAAFIPGVLWLMDLLAERLTYARFVGAAALWAVMLFGGHPETVSHTFFLAMITLLWLLFVERPFASWRDAGKYVLALGGAMTVAALLAAPFLLPFAEAMTKSKRYHELKAHPPGIMTPFSDWPSLIATVQPHFFGEVPFEQAWGPSHAEAISGFAGFLGIAGFFALVAHIIATRNWRSRETLFVIITLIALGIVMVWPVISDVFHFFFRLAANMRLRGLFALMVAIMAASLIDLLQRGYLRAYLLGILGAAGCVLWMFLIVDFEKEAWLQGTVAALLPTITVLALAALTPLLRGRKRHFAVLFVLVAVIAELWAAGRTWNPVLPKRLMYPKTPLIAKLLELKAQQREPFRIVATGPLFFPNVAAMYGLEDVRAHDPMANGRYLGVLRVATNYDTSDYFAKWNDLDTRLLDFLGVKYVITPPTYQTNDPDRYRLVYEGKDGRIYENRFALPRFYAARNVIPEFGDDAFVKKLSTHTEYESTALLDELKVEHPAIHKDFFAPRPPAAPRATVTLQRATPTDYTMRVNAPRWTLVVSSIPYWPGWRVTRNGDDAPLIRVNGTFLAYAVPPGLTEVRVRYAPWSWRIGVGLSLLTMLALVVIGRMGRIGPIGRMKVPSVP